MNNAYLLPSLQLAPAAVARVVRAIPPELYDTKKDPNRFSLREALCHLADWEAIHVERMSAALEEDGAPVQGIDEGARAVEQGYAHWDVGEQLARFEQGRSKLVAFLSGLSPEQWLRCSVHSERGRMTIYDQANLVVGHDMYHLEQFTQYMGS